MFQICFRSINYPCNEDTSLYRTLYQVPKLSTLEGFHCMCFISHAIGQFWNVPVELAPFSGTLRNGVVYEDAYTITVARSGSPTRVFTGQLDDRIWDRSLRPCLYAGNQQAGAIYEVVEPNDPVIEGTYASYRVPSAFDETDYQFSRFEESMCL